MPNRKELSESVLTGQIVTGLGVSAGLASGPVHLVDRVAGIDLQEPPCSNVPADLERVKVAMAVVAHRLQDQMAQASGAGQEILQATSQMARDKGLVKGIEKQLRQGLGVTAAVQAATEKYAKVFESLGGYMAERVADLYDVRDRLLCELQGLPEPGIGNLQNPVILVATDLSPAQTAVLDLSKVKGIITEQGSPTSHTAILCAQLGIPAVVRVAQITQLEPGTPVAIDGSQGEIFIRPSAQKLAELERQVQVRQELLAKSIGPGKTADGYPIKLLANIGSLCDAQIAASAVENDPLRVEGSGLFRTEFLFLDRETAPSYEEQVSAYTQVLAAFGQRRVVVRTLDAGADKPLKFADQGAEENPALGLRGLRLSRVRSELLDTQLTALSQAAKKTSADLWVMAPMVATKEEADWFAQRARAVGLKKVGIMVEIPAAALNASDLLSNLDFASIGTNDLAQYTMAADRMQGELAELNSTWQPAVLRLIQIACAGAANQQVPIGVCGEAGGDPVLALVLVGLGVGSLSMAPNKIPLVRQSLAQISWEDCRRLAELALGATTAQQAQQNVWEQLPATVKELV